MNSVVCVCGWHVLESRLPCSCKWIQDIVSCCNSSVSDVDMLTYVPGKVNMTDVFK